MTGTLSARAGSAAAGLGLAYVAALLGMTNLIFSADVTASTRLPGTVVRTGTYGINPTAAPTVVAAASAVAPAIASPPVALSPAAGSPALVTSVAAAPAPVENASDQVTNYRREGYRRPQSSGLQGQPGQYHRDEEQNR